MINQNIGMSENGACIAQKCLGETRGKHLDFTRKGKSQLGIQKTPIMYNCARSPSAMVQEAALPSGTMTLWNEGTEMNK